MPRKDMTGIPISAQAQQDLVSDGIENFELPKSIVSKIAKSALPDNAKLQKETVLSLVKGSTVFINYLAATAHDVAVSKQHKSISASDVLKALEMIEFGDLVDKLQGELVVYRQQAKNDKTKKGTSNVGSASAPGGKVRAVPHTGTAPPAGSSKSKGKEKAAVGPPFTSTPLTQSRVHEDAGESASATGARTTMEVDWEEELGEAADAVEHDQDQDTEGANSERGLDADDVDADLARAVDDVEEDYDEGGDNDEGVEDGGDEAPEDVMEVEQDALMEDALVKTSEPQPHGGAP
ncbi:hypothetical protein DXG03_009272 [Asterophora parasitica]|uniref:DNA polymerase epsilon subunit D n=1 Tax=Asterophora parasitica TaxID=117018 RepID=A0A9P7G893_9AGAR|nr:hypothetical protein DXG03_009272 [Asterophora parasitica]